MNQSDYRFTLIDRNGVAMAIDEPTGWADFTSRITRNMERHGIDSEIQTNSFQFTGDTAAIIRAEYQAYMAQGNMQLKVEARTSTGFQLLYQGQLSFGDTYRAEYNGQNGYYCVKIDCNKIGPYLDLVNRMDQSVDLTNTKCFDGTTDLAAYPFLNFLMPLPSKAILLKDYAYPKLTDEPTDSLSYDIWGDAGYSNRPNAAQKGIIIPRLNQVDFQEATDFKPGYQFDYIEANTQTVEQALDGAEVLKLNYKSTLIRNNTYNIDIRQKGTFFLQYQASSGAGNSISYKLTAFIKYKNFLNVINPVVIGESAQAFGASSTPFTRTLNIDLTFTGAVDMDAGDRLWVYYLLEISNASQSVVSPYQSLKISTTGESHVGIQTFSKALITDARVFMLYEAISRTVEAITNNKLKLYSEYLGRTDSQPFQFSTTGCGGNRVLTNGKAIRKIIVGDGPNTGLFTSLKDEFEALKATDNIGMGLEGDRVRIEPWTWFYKNDVILTCNNVISPKREVFSKEIFKTFKFGYEKWESEDSNGLDDFFGKREYRLDISQAGTTLEQISKFIASGYAIEVTRRKGADSSDWRYDNDIFMICVEPNGATYRVELNNITNANNIIDPPTIYNFRISPVRNALRHFNRIIGSYRNVNTGHRIIFGSGDANYTTSGELTNTVCRLESGGLAENQDLNLSVFADQAAAMPIMWPERVSFTYPLGRTQYHTLQQNPYGLINFTSISENGAGWIQQVDYRASQGEADFILIPKIQ